MFTILPTSDRDRARAFYGEKLGLTPDVQPNGDLEYETGGTRFYVTRSVGKRASVGEERFQSIGLLVELDSNRA
jgi:catechol 2,3-dioxygenase-like lactoylglutathione lyase family enzyme